MSEKYPHPVGVIGAGNWGTVIAMLAAKNLDEVFLYDRNAARVDEINRSRTNTKYLAGISIPLNVHATNDLKILFDRCTLVLPAVPAKGFRAMARASAPFVRGDHILIHATKGLEPGTHLRMSEILAEEVCALRTGVLSGPTLAGELARGLPAAVVVASRFDEVIELAQSVFPSSQLRVYGNREPAAVEWAGALKNVLAIAAGMIHELGMGKNALAMVVARGLSEMSQLIASMGTKSATLFGLAGIGDILLTCTSPESRNFRAGQMLARGIAPEEIEKEIVMSVEGLNTLNVVNELATEKNVEMPITRALWQITYGRQDVKTSMRGLMDRPAKYEAFLV